jgi:geranylgeranyl pyrophosphate synthase
MSIHRENSESFIFQGGNSVLSIDSYKSSAACIDATLQKVLAIHKISHRENNLIEVSRYALAAQGKMIRGLMLLEACRAVGGDPETVLYAAAGAEYGHMASLVHDDLIDGDELRRGQRSVWRKYGADAAILSGDLFIFEAFHCLSLCRGKINSDLIVRVLEVFSKSCMDLCLGQSLEAQLSQNCSVGSDQYIEMIRLKTGSLFRAVLESGAILGGGTEAQIGALRICGENLGIAFQIIDDLLPYTSNECHKQKPKTSDVKNHRVTLPILYAFENGTDHDRHLLRVIFEETALDNDLDVAYDTVRAILERVGVKEMVEKEAVRRQQQALERLMTLPSGDGRDYLEQLSMMVVRRQL